MDKSSDNPRTTYPPDPLDEEDDSGACEGMMSFSSHYVNAPRMWGCVYCGGTEPDTRDGCVVVRCTRCGGPRAVEPEGRN